jgi:hypothetical protein
MLNTDDLQSHPDYFKTAPEKYIKIPTNKRYPFFRQIHFTAGDYDQFFQFWDRSSPSSPPPTPTHYGHVHPNTRLAIYKDITAKDVYHTFEYIFNKFKKGIFMKITDSVPKVFLPFSKVGYKNEWSSVIKINPGYYKGVVDMMAYIAKQEGLDFIEGRVHKDTRSWYGNNGLVRLEYPIAEGDSGVNMLRDMFLTLAAERKIPSCELFVNKRDFPILRKDGKEPYDSFFGQNTPLRSFAGRSFAPILGMTTTDHHADIPIPTWEDWSRVSYLHDKKLFAKYFRTYPHPDEFNGAWESRRATAVFRGASTGLGTTTDTNPRLFFSALSMQGRKDTDGIAFLDVGITRWNLRPRKHPDQPFLETIRVEDLGIPLVETQTPVEQARYKYVLHLPGHSAAYRLSLELMSGSVVLLYPCPYKLWYSHLLVPYTHYVPIDPSKPEDIYDKIRWCKANDDECRQIAARAREFADKHLSREAILDYLHDTLWTLYHHTKPILHNAPSPRDAIIHYENEFLCAFHENRRAYAGVYPIGKWLEKVCEDGLCSHLSPPLLSLVLAHMDPTKTVSRDISKNNVEIVCVGGHEVLRKNLVNKNAHEVVISYMMINMLSCQIPHFVYTYTDSWYHDRDAEVASVYMEYVKGQTMEDLINSPTVSIQRLVNLFMMIALALRHAQMRCGFMHMDMYPWNIIIKNVEQPVRIVYEIGDKTIEIETREIPVFIDYGRSHIVYGGRHYYNVSPFRISSIQDIVSIVFSTMNIFLSKNKLANLDIRIVLKIIEFFADTPYMPRSVLSSIPALKSFLRDKKKFSNMLMEPKTGLENKTPLHFYHHLVSLNLSHPWTVYRVAKPSASTPPRWKDYSVVPFLSQPVFLQCVLVSLFQIPGMGFSKEDKSVYLRLAALGLRKACDHILTQERSRVASMSLRIVREYAVDLLTEGLESNYIRDIIASIDAYTVPSSFSINIPTKSSVQSIPLISTHPFTDSGDGGGETMIHYNDRDWYEIFSDVTTTHHSFEMYTTCFRNFCLNEWNKYKK